MNQRVLLHEVKGQGVVRLTADLLVKEVRCLYKGRYGVGRHPIRKYIPGNRTCVRREGALPARPCREAWKEVLGSTGSSA